MFRRILVPLDGSPRAELALTIAARLARGSGSTLVLYRVVGQPSALALYELAPPTVPQPETAALHAQAAAYLAAVAQREIVRGLDTEVVVTEGLVAEELLAAVPRHAIDLVVICSHGHTESTRWLLGSVAEKVARLSEAPVLVLREHGITALARAAEQADSHHPLRVLIPLDGSPLAEAALTPALDLATALTRQIPADLRLLCVLPPPDGQMDVMHGELVRRVNEYLDRVASRLKAHAPAQAQPEVAWSVAFESDIAAMILRMAGQEVEAGNGRPPSGDYHLIAMTTHGGGGKRPWSIGTVADRVLYATELPLLLVRP